MFDYAPPTRGGASKAGPADVAGDAVRDLLKEVRSDEQGGDASTKEEEKETAPAAEPPQEEPKAAARGLAPGVVVELRGLQAKPELNGQRGRLVALDEAKGRWQVRFKDGNTRLLKADNLEPVASTGERAAQPKRAAAAERPPAKQAAAPAPAAPQRRPLPTGSLSPEEAVEWINSACDEFEALLLPLQLEEDPTKIRKQYRQLSLLVHPDKNPHKEADAAFKKIFGAMQKLSDPMEQRVALRRARSRASGRVGGADDGSEWWQQATVDEMEKAFRDMEQKYQKMGFFDIDKQMVSGSTGVNEDQLWAPPELARDLLEKDLAIFLDSRNTTDFDVSHVRGAHSLPGHTMEQLATIEFTPAFRLLVENPEQTVIVYSDNGSQLSRCVHVARALRMRPQIVAQRVLRLSGGLNAWKRHGFPVDGDTRALFAGQVLGASMMRLGTG